jgi:broad specificity phosphatase PhoE
MLLLLARHGNTFEASEKAVWVGARTDLPLTVKGREQAQALAAALQPVKPRIGRVISGPLKRTREHAVIVCETLSANRLKTPSPPPSPSKHDLACLPIKNAISASGYGGEREQGVPYPHRSFSPRGEGQDEGGLFRSLKASLSIDERLREIDYGLWEGKSSEEIRALGGDCELRAWNERGEWPRSPQWTPSPETIEANAAELASELAAALPEGRAALLVTSNGILKFFLKLVPGAFEEMSARGALKVATGNCCALRYSERGWQVVFWDCEPSHLALS